MPIGMILVHRKKPTRSAIIALLSGAPPLGAAQDKYPQTGEPPMADMNHRFIDTNGIGMHIAEQGEGPLVVLCHGFPECWYAWRHQLPALAEAGYHVVAPDQ